MPTVNPTHSPERTTPQESAQATADPQHRDDRPSSSSRSQQRLEVPIRTQRPDVQRRRLSSISESGSEGLEISGSAGRREPPPSLRRGSATSDDSMHSAVSEPAEETFNEQLAQALERLARRASASQSREISPAASAATSQASATAAVGAVAGLETVEGGQAIEMLTSGVEPNEAADLSAPQQQEYLNELARNRPAGSMAASAVVEFVAKAVVSGIHFGVVQSYVLMAADKLLDERGVTDPVARAAAQAALVGPPLAISHYVAEVILRTAGVSAAPRQQVPTDVKRAFPDTSEGFTQRRATMTAQQSAAKPGQPIGDIIGLASFAVSNGIREAAGGDNNQSNVLASAMGGAFMALGHTLVNFATGTRTAEGERVPSHVVAGVPTPGVPQPSIPDKVGKAVPAALKATSKAKDADGKDAVGLGMLGNVVHEIFVAREAGLTQGEFIKQVFASKTKPQLPKTDPQMPKTEPESPSVGKRFASGAAGPLAILGLGFFPNSAAKGLATNRGNTAGRFAGSTKAIKGLDPRKNSGTTRAVIGSEDPDTAMSQVRNLLASVVDGSHQTVASFLRLPASVTIDLFKLAAEVPAAIWQAASPESESRDAPPHSNV